MPKTRKLVAISMCVCLMLSVLAGCGTPATNASPTTEASASATASASAAAENGKTITIAEPDMVVSLDPVLAEDSFSCMVVGNTIEGLYSMTPEGKIENAMAKEVKVSDDGLTWTFTLRDDAVWSNGDPVIADDFVFGIQRIADPAANSGFSYHVGVAHIKNAEDVSSGKVPVDSLGVTAPDDKTVVIELDTPCPYLPQLLAFSAFAPTHRSFFTEKGDKFGLTADDLLYNGPYVVSTFDTGRNSVTITKNDKYFDAANVDIDQINFQVIGDTQEAVMAYEKGDVDAIALTGDLVEKYKDDPAFQSGLGMFQWYISFNTTDTGVPNENLRKAIAYAIDRVTLCDNILKDGSIPSNCMVQRGFCFGPDGKDFVDTCGTDHFVYDTAKAAEYWEKAQKETDMRSFTLIYEEDNAMIASVAPYVQSAIESALPGFTVELQIMPKKSRLDKMKNLDYQAALHRFGPDYADPTAIMAMFTTGHPSNYAGSKLTEADKYYTEANTTLAGDAQARWDALVKAEGIMLDACIAIPIFQCGSARLVNPKLHNYVEHFTGTPYVFKYMTLDK